MSNTKIVRNELNKVAQQIESLARQVQAQLSTGGDLLPTANELARNSSTFVFVLGELSGLEQTSKGGSKKVQTTVVSNPSNTNVSRNYHNVRDSLGRFTRV